MTPAALRDLPSAEGTGTIVAVQGVRALSPDRGGGIRRRLVRQARLFDDPGAYAADVLDALEAATRPAPGSPPRRPTPVRGGP